MRDAFNFNILPIAEDNNIMTDIVLNPHQVRGGSGITTSISSNGYYGYQPVPLLENKNQPAPDTLNADDDDNMKMDHHNIMPFDNINNDCLLDDNRNYHHHQQQHHHDLPRLLNRKRGWEYGYSNEFREFKKRRQNDTFPITFDHLPPPTANTHHSDVKLRKPTHNMPDMPRSIMAENLILVSTKRRMLENNERIGAKNEQLLVEDLLQETHGCSIYHWSMMMMANDDL